MTECAASPQAAIAELVELTYFVGLADFTELAELMEKYLPPAANPHLYAEHAIHGMEYLHWPAWAGGPAVLPPSSCAPAH